MRLTAQRLNFYKFLALKLADDDLCPCYQYGEKFTFFRPLQLLRILDSYTRLRLVQECLLVTKIGMGPGD
jgi:hypothetical protein